MASEQALPRAAAGWSWTLARLVDTVGRWWVRGLCSLADQGLSSAAHFALNLLLARWLTPAEYGAFALSFAVLLLSAGLYSALILEPMGVMGPTRYAERLPSYLGLTVWMHAGLSLPVSAALAIGALAARLAGSTLWPSLFALSAAAPGILLLWLMRRACYMQGTPQLAAKGSLVYAALLGAGLFWLSRHERPGAAGVFLLMSGAGVVVSLLLASGLGLRREHLLWPTAKPELQAAIRLHWSYGRWALSRGVAYWMGSSLYLPAVGALAGLPAVAAYRAADNLTQPMGQTLTALALLMLPWLSRQHSLRGGRRLKAIAVNIGLAASLAVALYVAGILAAGPNLLRRLYGSSFYTPSFALVPFLGAALVFRGIGDTGLGLAARAAGRPDLDFPPAVAAAVVTLSAGLLLVARYGAAGAALGSMFSAATSCLVSAFLVRRLWKTAKS